MSNASDVAMWALGLGDSCPALSAIQAALKAANPQYATNGAILFSDPTLGTVTLVDATNGLVHISAADAKAPGATFCCAPTALSLDPKGQGVATIEENTANAGSVFMWVRVRPMVAQDSSARAFVFAPLVNNMVPWLPNAWSLANALQDWPSVIDHVLNHWNLPK